MEFFRDGVDNGLVVFVTINKVIDFGVFKFLIKSVVLFGRAGLFCQRFKPKFKFVQNVFYARKAFVGAVEFSFGLVLLRLEVGNARCFFKDAASVDGFRLNNLRDATLPDDAVTFAADTGVVQKRDDVFKAAFLLVDKIFADAASVDFRPKTTSSDSIGKMRFLLSKYKLTSAYDNERRASVPLKITSVIDFPRIAEGR